MDQVYSKFEDKLFNERIVDLSNWIEELREKNVKKKLKIVPTAIHKYKKESAAVLDYYNCEYLVSRL